MALAEARAVWQRTANRCFVQEDAKRAPKLACCPSLTPSSKETELRPSDSYNGTKINYGIFVPSNREPLYRDLSPNTRLWQHLQQGYGYHHRLVDEKLAVMESNDETSHFKQSLEDILGSDTDYVIVDQTSAESVHSNEFVVNEEKFTASYDPRKSDCLGSNSGNYFDSESSWIEVDKSNNPWWRTADSEGLALLVAQSSCSVIENCDLPLPQNGRGNSDRSTHSYENLSPSIQQSLIQPPTCSLSFTDPVASNTAGQTSYQKHGSHSESRYGGETAKTDENSELLNALRHSQTRARESDKVAKEAIAEKEHIVKIFLRQASHLFAYKQWLQLLQLENNRHLLALHRKSLLTFSEFQPITRPKVKRKPLKRHCTYRDISKYAMVFVVGLSLVGVGLMLGWGVASLPLVITSG